MLHLVHPLCALLLLCSLLYLFICCDRLVTVALYPINAFHSRGSTNSSEQIFSQGIHYQVKYTKRSCGYWYIIKNPWIRGPWCVTQFIAVPLGQYENF